MKTAGKPLEEAVRRVLDMPSPTGVADSFASKVTPLHIYVAKKMSTPTAKSEMLPPGHLPSPLPLLGFFLSVILYVGGTALLPRWNVRANVFLNYEKQHINNADYALQNWFDENNEDDIDPFYASSSKKHSTPAVLIYEVETQKVAVCPLFRSPGTDDNDREAKIESEHPRRYYFELDQKRYYYDPIFSANKNSQSPAVVSGGPTIHEADLLTLLSNSYTRGLQSNAQLAYAQGRYAPYSDMTIPVPTLRGAFIQHISSPLVSLQLIGRLLSLIEEESIGRALADLAKLGFQHFVDAKRNTASARVLAEEVKGMDKTGNDMNGSKSRFWAVRPVETTTAGNSGEDEAKAEWVQVSPKDLLPGDVFVIAQSQTSHTLTIPVDALLLEGTCVTEEAALTGESVPQAKVPLEVDSADSAPLDISGTHRSSCVFAGTNLMHNSNWDEGTASNSSAMFNLPSLPRETFTNDTLPAIFLTLRTGSYSSRGEIIQSLLKSRMSMGVTNRRSEIDSMRLIGALALFAVGACVFLLIDTPDGRQRDSVFKRMVQCTRIAVSSVPSDLPAYISASAHECATILRKEYDAVNSQSGALLESAHVDTVVFDKTGTLTADTQALTSIVYPPRKSDTRNDSPELLTNLVLAGGHTLVGMNDDKSNLNLVGDPLDLACLRHTHWKYDAHQKSAASNEKGVLWQIRSFPFDPIKKLSSAMILVQTNDDVFQLWVVAKGAPNKIRNLVEIENEGLANSWYDANVKRLGKLGYRSIGLGALDVTDTKAADILFPLGLPKSSDSEFTLETRIHEARSHARSSLVRNDIERQSSSILNTKEMKFVGFACFSAPMRTSSPRVVNELKSSAEVIMLTGDEPYASFASAQRANITDSVGSRMCLLKTNDSGLVWEINNKLKEFSLETARKVRRDVENKRAALIVSGDAVSALLSETTIDKTTQFAKKELLPRASLIASASPSDKSLFVKWLQSSCKKTVLMCGDGVNDIAAMREATVSCAMLSGFGHEPEGTHAEDTEDLRRKERLKRRYIGSNRLKIDSKNPSTLSKQSILDDAGVGDSAVASSSRIRQGIIKGMRQHPNEDNSNPNPTTVFDVCISSFKDEFKRHRDLKKGGSNAAKILAEEDRLRRSLQSKADIENSTVEVDGIQTGESCLASSFTLLKPCVSGVESILRTGVAAAACGISLYRKVALNCMLSCYNLATLYKNGLRYGKYMWQIEMWSSVFTDRASFTASSTPRPRLVAGVRPSTTPFEISEVLSTILQAIIHIVTLTCAVNIGKQLEANFPTKSANKGFVLKYSDNSDSASVGSLLATLVGSSTSNSLHSDTDAPPQTFFRRTPFQPNYIANNVFIVSVFQNAVTTMVNHSGRPFSVGFLESRPLSLSVSLAFLLCIVCIAESFPMLNQFIQLEPYPTKASRIAMLRLLLLNVSMSYFAEYFSTFLFRNDIWKERNKPTRANSHDAHESLLSAADEEEKLLSEEHQQNSRIVSLVCLLIFYYSIQIMFK